MSALLSAYGIIVALVIIVIAVLIIKGALIALPAFIVLSIFLLLGIKAGGLFGGAIIVIGIVISWLIFEKTVL